ncbi:hypothetical protein PsAD2_04459 [Pseudovibrio axinellae]|uniref:DUF4440 domain-containing protein n=1 Tax=Pseudovibrio axinellae TaxID=989403 RepID=A0A165SZX3_9HYPH|nr:DUF4440 domain-containing protein [Pseudovibrio axinellae]KZL05104.1 hypothetical protein PsAD2_04459 [Pseudovibrio axinellae]SER48403.1 ribonuclease HI [Pseudovibrio axinellae]
MLEILFSLEKQLLNPAARASAQQLEMMLHEDFIEIGASGRIYDRSQIINELLGSAADYPMRTLKDFRVRGLSGDLVQVFYDIAENGTRRSSIWKLEDSNWRIIFHQGTPTAL